MGGKRGQNLRREKPHKPILQEQDEQSYKNKHFITEKPRKSRKVGKSRNV